MKIYRHRQKKSVVLGNLAMLGVMLFLIGCSSGPTDVEGQNPVDDDPLALGWNHFAVGEFEDALEIFLAEAEGDSNGFAPLVGMGWCFLSLDNLNEAKGVFQEALDIFQDNTDAGSGMALTLSALRNNRECVKWVDYVLSIDPAYKFEYQADINEDRLQLVAAKCWYMESQYDKCQKYLSKVGGYKTVDMAGENHVEQLIAEIVRLEANFG